MRIHALQHVSFEGLGSIEQWITGNGHHLSRTRLFAGDALPRPEAFDRLIIMGGPMNIYQEAQYPWLKAEKGLIREAIAVGKSVVGICLGAQLLADALGAPVFAGPQKEIGWLPITLTQAGKHSDVLRGMPEYMTVFHWHGDTFDIPPGAVHLAESEGCRSQAFLYDKRILGLQFHLESTPETVAQIVAHCRSELVPGAYIQSEADIVSAAPQYVAQNNILLGTLLSRLP